MKYQGDDLLAFPSQIIYAMDHFDQVNLSGIAFDSIDHIVICGLGGSGIAGRLIQSFFLQKSKRAVQVVSDYSLPQYVSKDTLVICSSYSGNTEETLSCYNQASDIGAKIIAITSGGTLAQSARNANLPTYISQGGFQPRMALGYSLTYLLLIMGEICEIDFRGQLTSIAAQLEDSKTYQNKAATLLGNLEHAQYNFLQIVTDGPSSALCVRFQQQLNENCKSFAQVHEIPEMCHNVIEAITSNNITSPWLLVNSGSHDRVNTRFEFLQELLATKGYTYQTVNADVTTLEHLLHTVYTLDWYSLLFADMQNVNSAEIPNILSLKARLSE